MRLLCSRRRALGLLLLVACALGAAADAAAQFPDPLPSWRSGATKRALLRFVENVSTPGRPRFVPAEERVAVFDNDGTLWSEQPMYVQLAFALDRVKALAPEHPEWKTQQPFKAALEGDMKALGAAGTKGLLELLMATHAGMTTEEFAAVVRDWMAKARHPKTGRPYTEMVYQPMLELMAYLRKRGFRVYIVSGGGVAFMRPWVQAVYGVAPEQVVGSSIETAFEMRDGEPVLVRKPELHFIDDKEGKPVAIDRFIGRRPLAAFGNSDGDLQMLQWTTAGEGARFGLIVHHTDAQREVAYDRDSPVGQLDVALREAPKRGWTVVDMKRDWGVIFPPLEPTEATRH